MEDSGELEAIVERALEAHPDEAEKVRGGGMQAIGPHHRLRHERDEGPADGKEVTRIVREKLS